MSEPTTAAEVEAYALRKQLEEERAFKGELRQDNHNLSVELAAARLDISSLRAALDSSYKMLNKADDKISLNVLFIIRASLLRNCNKLYQLLLYIPEDNEN